MMDSDFSGKVVVVTGGASGIGRAIAEAFAAAGALLAVMDVDHEQTAGLLDVLEGEGHICVTGDAGVEEDLRFFAEKVLEHFGRVDVLVNNAGITRDNLILRMSEEEFDAVVETNLKGCFHTIRHLSRYFLKQRSGCIINMASVVGVAGNAGQANYAASKAGIIGLTKTVARELASRGITVNAVAPGFVHTEMTEVLSEQVKEAAVAQIPLGRFGEPEDIANVVAFLASEKADYITGQVICVDGGMVM